MAADKEIRIRAAALTDVGRVREKNEDNYFIMTIGPEDVRPPGVRAVAVVADGMGGHVGGEVASGTAVRLIGGSFVTEDGWGLSRFGDNIVDATVNLIGEADRRIRSLAKGGEKPPGTTLTAAFVIGNSVYIGHIGDSRAYVIRDKTIKAVTEDHSLLGELIRSGKIDPKDAGNFKGKNVITRALGAGSKIKIDMPVRVDLIDGDVLFLCSDGLWDLVSDEEILGAIHHEAQLNGGLKRLVDLANGRGGLDNITVAALEFGRMRRDRRFGGALIGIGEAPPLGEAAPGDRIQAGYGAGKIVLNTPVIVALTTFGLALTILMFVGFWYAVGAVIGLIKGKAGDIPGPKNGVEMVVPEKGRDREGMDKDDLKEKKKQKIEMEKGKETEEEKKQPITNLPEGQI
ncbi:MAG: serine/threonine-protein phosphatase [Deltaproteobacteria bacterium]|uniref:Serine/threonine-protein phosphatase n=1 Tax=Candidatus Zymogenus saltonus TaxID=2844893 RepID=A0A9D8PNR7_9DELT|nr:serine/threonine-protein phosphatase [Candidatus Zymogenus saltonus]